MSSAVSRSLASSSSASEPNAALAAARKAATGERSADCASNSPTARTSSSSRSTTSSLVGKYRKNVLGETSAASAIWSTVVAS